MEEETAHESENQTKCGGSHHGGIGVCGGGPELEVCGAASGPTGSGSCRPDGRGEPEDPGGSGPGLQPAAGPADETEVYAGSDYFASARLTRQQARDSAISLLQEAAEQENADAAVANEASESIQVLAAYTLQEAQIENLVTAKGYTACVAFLGDYSLSVVVSTASGELTGEDVAKITDIAMTETGLSAGAIKIMAAN